MPAAASSPGAWSSSPTDGRLGGAERSPRPQSHVGTGEDGDRPGIGPGREAVEHVDTAPGPVTTERSQADVPLLAGRGPAPGDG